MVRLLFHSLLKRVGFHLKLHVEGQGGGAILDVDGQWVGGLEN